MDGRRHGSGGCGDDHDPAERLDDLIGPRPAAGQSEVSAPAAADEAGGDVQHLEPQPFRLGGGQVTGAPNAAAAVAPPPPPKKSDDLSDLFRARLVLGDGAR